MDCTYQLVLVLLVIITSNSLGEGHLHSKSLHPLASSQLDYQYTTFTTTSEHEEAFYHLWRNYWWNRIYEELAGIDEETEEVEENSLQGNISVGLPRIYEDVDVTDREKCKKKGEKSMKCFSSNVEKEEGAVITGYTGFSVGFRLGDKIRISCKARGNPIPNIIWFKDGVEMSPHIAYYVEKVDIEDEVIKSNIEVEPALIRDTGYYSCLASNKWSTDERTLHLFYLFDENDVRRHY